MGITITNRQMDAVDRLVELASFGLTPYRAKLLVELDASGEKVQEILFPQNAEGYSVGRSSTWSPRRAPGVRFDLSDFVGHDPASLSLRLLVSAQGDPLKLEQDFLLRLENAASVILKETLEGPRAALVQGAYFFRGHIQRLNVERKRTDYRGYAEVAEVSLEMTRNDPF